MARKPNPARIYDARRAATETRLTGAGMPQEDAERWLAAWEDEAALLGLEEGRPRVLGAWRPVDRQAAAPASLICV